MDWFWTKRSRASLSQWSGVDLCDRHDEPGTKTDDAALVDYSTVPATPDQLAIEEVLHGMNLGGARILHVGVGDSGLAERFHGRAEGIDGITVSENELRRGESLKLPKYRVWRVNKYTRDFTHSLRPGYRAIVDNNPASFACCAFHLAVLMDNYRWALDRGGELLAHQRGLRWVAGDRAWRMTFQDLADVGRRFGFEAIRHTESVYSLRRA